MGDSVAAKLPSLQSSSLAALPARFQGPRRRFEAPPLPIWFPALRQVEHLGSKSLRQWRNLISNHQCA